MPLDVPVNIFSWKKLRPVRNAVLAAEQEVNLSAGTYLAGTTMGQVAASANAVQTISTTSTGGSSKLILGFPAGNPQTTAAIAFVAGLSAATVQAAIVGLPNVGPGNATVTGTGPWVVTFAGLLASRPIPLMTVDNTLATGGTSTVALTTPGVTAGQFTTYASGNSDGSQNPKGFLGCDCVVDAAGYVTYGTSTTGGYQGEKYLTAPLWYRGEFSTADLIGLDANAITKLAGLVTIGAAGGPGVFKF